MCRKSQDRRVIDWITFSIKFIKVGTIYVISTPLQQNVKNLLPFAILWYEFLSELYLPNHGLILWLLFSYIDNYFNWQPQRSGVPRLVGVGLGHWNGIRGRLSKSWVCTQKPSATFINKKNTRFCEHIKKLSYRNSWLFLFAHSIFFAIQLKILLTFKQQKKSNSLTM